MDDRMVQPTFNAGTWTLGLVPRRTRNFAPPRSVRGGVLDEGLEAGLWNMRPEDERPAEDFGLGSVVGCSDEGSEVLVGDREGVYVEGRERHWANRAFAVSGKAMGIVRAHEEAATKKCDDRTIRAGSSIP